MKARVPILLILGVFAGLSAISCGGGAKNTNPAGPGSAAPATAAAPSTDGDSADLTGGSDVSASGASIQTWHLKDACVDGRGIRYRLFDMNTGARTKQFKIRSGSSQNLRVLCNTGHKICVGATQDPPHGIQWGVGLDGSGKISAPACATCSSRSKNVTFLCRKKSAGSLDVFGGDDEDLDADE